MKSMTELEELRKEREEIEFNYKNKIFMNTQLKKGLKTVRDR